MTLTEQYRLIGRSADYAFSDKGKVCACLYARVDRQDAGALCSTVSLRLTRILSGVSGVGYAHAGAQATLSGSLTHGWTGGGSGMVYVGEYTVFEQSFPVYHQNDGMLRLSLSAVYDDTYITPLTLDAACDLPPIDVTPDPPRITSLHWDTGYPSRFANVSIYWEGQGDAYLVSVVRKGGEVVYTGRVLEPSVTLGLGNLPLAAGEEVCFTVVSLRGSAQSEAACTAVFRLGAALWVNVGGWKRATPWVRVGGVWVSAHTAYAYRGGWRPAT